MTTPLFTLANTDDGTEVNVYANTDGSRFNVVFRDTDAQATVAVKVVATLAAAKAAANAWLAVPTGHATVTL